MYSYLETFNKINNKVSKRIDITNFSQDQIIKELLSSKMGLNKEKYDVRLVKSKNKKSSSQTIEEYIKNISKTKK